jgi:hypothetical protein
MSQYAWANPTNGIREQDDNLHRAIGRVQDELKQAHDFHAVMLYTQAPRVRVESSAAYTLVAPSRRTRFFDRLRLMFRRKPVETQVSDE